MIGPLTLFAGFPLSFRDITPYLVAIFIALLGSCWAVYYLLKKPRKQGQILATTILFLVFGGVMAVGGLLIRFMVMGRVFFWEW